eukprot:scaffold326_cov205-Alexandrium_tamarense.AAC.4
MSTTMKTSFALLFASVSTASAQLVDVYKNSRRTLLEQEAMSAKTQISLGMMLPRLRLKSIYLCLCRVAHKRLEVMHPGKVLTASAKCGENFFSDFGKNPEVIRVTLPDAINDVTAAIESFTVETPFSKW